MKAILLDEFGSAEKLKVAALPKPDPAAAEVLVAVNAISINPVDIKTRSGKGIAGRLKGHHPLVLGWDISGVVVQTGASASRFKVGDEVFGMVNFPGHGRAYAEYVAAPETHLALKPARVSHEEAAAATLAALTAWQAMTNVVKIKQGDRVLIHAAAGGVGHYAVQMAKHLGAHVIGTSSAVNKNFVLGLGADAHIDYHAQPFEEAVSEIDFVLDSVGGENIGRSLQVIRKGGSIISIPSGLNEEVMQKAALSGISGYQFLVASNGSDMETIASLLQKNIIKSHISATYAFEQMAGAHRHIETGRTVGKIIVTL